MQQDRFTRNSITTAPPVELSVVMPCFNESQTIEDTLRRWDLYLQDSVSSFELIVVNDGSKDGTGRILDRLRRELRTLRVIHQLNLGPGRATRRGYEAARGKYIMQIDCNGSVGPEEFSCLWEARYEHHLIIARRIQRMEGALQQLGMHLFVRFVQTLFKTRLEDPSVSFRLFRRDAAAPLLNHLPAALNSVNLALSILLEREYPAQVTEVPLALRNRHRLASRRGLFAECLKGAQTLGEVMRLRFPRLGRRPALRALGSATA